jgi:hypothetical protein
VVYEHEISNIKMENTTVFILVAAIFMLLKREACELTFERKVALAGNA